MLSTLPNNPGDSRFWTVSPGLQIRVWNLPDNCQSLLFLVDSTFCQWNLKYFVHEKWWIRLTNVVKTPQSPSKTSIQMRLRRGPTASDDFDKYCESCEVKIRQTFGEILKEMAKWGPYKVMILTKITNLAKICHFIRRTSCKLIQIFANPLALFFQIRHFRHCMPTFLGMSVLCSMFWQQGCPKLSRHNVSNPKTSSFWHSTQFFTYHTTLPSPSQFS